MKPFESSWRLPVMDIHPDLAADLEVKARTGTRSLDHGHWMRVGPGTDAVVWKLCDTNETVEL